MREAEGHNAKEGSSGGDTPGQGPTGQAGQTGRTFHLPSRDEGSRGRGLPEIEI